ncbi:MAG: hypothetical protein JSS53_09895, partial [Proteobacteria bacterium]|nr:hypothetical protein [Pseudomonadota bacterium]
MNPELVNLEREKTAKEILDKVNTVFVFGATNKQRTREARRKFDLLLKAITDLFLSTKKETVNKRERFFKKHSKQRAVFDKLLEEALIVSDTSNFTPGIFKPAEKIL